MDDFIRQANHMVDSLDEAVQVLKPEPVSRREEFSANLPAEFRKLWEMTEDWERWTAPNHFANFEVLPHAMSDLTEDGTTSKSRCKERAERQLRRAYREAENFLGTGADGMSTFVLERLKEYLTEQFHQVHHLLRLMTGTPGIQEELTQIGELADFGRAEDAARIKLEENVGSEHRLSGFSYYADEIQYLDDDMGMEDGFLRIWEKAFVHYNFDASNAYFKIREDTQQCYDTYRDEVDWFMPELLSTIYSRRVREYLTEIEAKLRAEKAVGA